MSYQRVIPRDLFNEAKLLKCLGRLSLLLHEGGRDFGGREGLTLEHFPNDDYHPGFEIDLDRDNVALVCTNLTLWYKGNVVPLSSPYNSKQPFPLVFGEFEGTVFNDSGDVTPEFLAYLDNLKEAS